MLLLPTLNITFCASTQNLACRYFLLTSHQLGACQSASVCDKVCLFCSEVQSSMKVWGPQNAHPEENKNLVKYTHDKKKIKYDLDISL
jgi:hypothetical protein